MNRAAVPLLLLLAAGTARAGVVKGPYLQDARRDRITVCAETDGSSSCAVEWGSGLSQRLELAASGQHHEGTISGLPASTCQPYRLVCDGQPGPEQLFCTAPEVHEPFQFVIMGDTRSDHAAHQQILDRVAAENPDFFINTGDLVSSGEQESDWEPFFQIEGSLMATVPLYPVVGNHDEDNGALDIYERLFALPTEASGRESYYAFSYGNTRFIVLDNQASQTWGWNLDNAQKDWFSGQLSDAASDADTEHILVLVHECIYSSKDGRSGDWVLRSLRDQMKSAGVEVLVCGHDHYYERGEADNGLVYIISGGGGAPLYDTSNPTEGQAVNIALPAHTIYYSKKLHHYLVARVRGSYLQLCAKDSAGVEFDCIDFGQEQPDGGVDAGDGGGVDAGDGADGDGDDGGPGDDGGGVSDEGGGCDCSTEPTAEVCGEDGTTYRNECELDCAQVGKAYDGPCDADPCARCPDTSDPVCGRDGQTYRNACLLECQGVELAHQGACSEAPDCDSCPSQEQPVCGQDGRTYRNECVLLCMQVPKAHDGACEQGGDGCGCASASPGSAHAWLPLLLLLLLLLPGRRRA